MNPLRCARHRFSRKCISHCSALFALYSQQCITYLLEKRKTTPPRGCLTCAICFVKKRKVKEEPTLSLVARSIRSMNNVHRVSERRLRFIHPSLSLASSFHFNSPQTTATLRYTTLRSATFPNARSFIFFIKLSRLWGRREQEEEMYIRLRFFKFVRATFATTMVTFDRR